MALPDISNQNIDEVLRHIRPLVDTARTRKINLESAMEAMLLMMESTGFMAAFNWVEEFRERRELLDSDAALSKIDLERLRKIMTAHVRMDRFDNGHLLRLVRSGYWRSCYQRLVQLREERAE